MRQTGMPNSGGNASPARPGRVSGRSWYGKWPDLPYSDWQRNQAHLPGSERWEFLDHHFDGISTGTVNLGDNKVAR